jgi:hypothetical protein
MIYQYLVEIFVPYKNGFEITESEYHETLDDANKHASQHQYYMIWKLEKDCTNETEH